MAPLVCARKSPTDHELQWADAHPVHKVHRIGVEQHVSVEQPVVAGGKKGDEVRHGHRHQIGELCQHAACAAAKTNRVGASHGA